VLDRILCVECCHAANRDVLVGISPGNDEDGDAWISFEVFLLHRAGRVQQDGVAVCVDPHHRLVDGSILPQCCHDRVVGIA
jgi:hypothetical protein